MTPAAVVGRLTAMQAQEHSSARWSVAQRTAESPAAGEVDRAFDEGHIVRTHVLRPTWHLVAADDVRWLIALSGPRVDASHARRYHDLGLDAPTLNRSNDVIAEAVASGARTRRELAAVLEGHGIAAEGDRATYLLMHAELTAVVCSGPVRGKQHTYAAFDQRVLPGNCLDTDEALAELAWRYFSSRGPATVRDFSWWAGITARDARRGLGVAQPRLVSREVDGRTYWAAEQSFSPPTVPAVDLVQCYDEVIISYSESRDVLRTTLANFPVPGYVDGFRHVLLMDGRLLGHWRPRSGRDGVQIETRTSRPLDAGDQLGLRRAVDRYRQFAQPEPSV